MAETASSPTPAVVSDADSTYDHIIKYTSLFGGVQGLTMFMSVVRNKIAAVLLGPDGIAIINLFNNAINLLGQATNFGLSFSVVKHVAELSGSESPEALPRFVHTVRTWSLFTALLGMFLCLALSPLLSRWTFGNDLHTLHFVLLSLMVAMLTVQGNEMAILKGAKQLNKVALVSVFGAVGTLLLCAPLYFFLGQRGIVPSLLAISTVVLAIHLHYSTRVVPWSASLFSSTAFHNGLPMLRLGVGYVVAGIFGQGAEYLIRTQILHHGQLADVGLYNSGYSLAVLSAGIVFVAFEADYFPRLSTTQHDVPRQNLMVNQQIEVSVLLIAPLLIAMVLAMPIIVPLLFSAKFVAAVPMTICASLYLFFKALILPAAYLPLARGDSRMYMSTELAYDIFIAIAIPQAFRLWGLPGAGWALSVAGLFDFLLIHTLYRFRYHFLFDVHKLPFYLVQFLLVAASVASTLCANPWWRLSAVAALLLSAGLSLHLLRHKTHLILQVKQKLWRK